MKTKKLLLLFFMCSMATNALASICEYYPDSGARTRTIILPASVSIPRDAPNGTEIYQSSSFTASESNRFTCFSTFLVGIKNFLGADVHGTIQPIGDTGIGWQWIYDGTKRNGVANGDTYAPNSYVFAGSVNSVRFVKIGAIKDNARIPAGDIGAIQTGPLFPFTINISGMSILVPSCETPDVIVDMRSQDLSQFSDNTPYTASAPFIIKLNNCPSGIRKVHYQLVAPSAAPAIDPAIGVIALNSTSTAKGIALQVMDAGERPINLNLTHVFSSYSASGGNFEIPLFARYLKRSGGGGQPEMKAGTANAELTFIMSYL